MKKGILFPLISLASLAMLATLACNLVMGTANGESVESNDSVSAEVVSSETTTSQTADLQTAFEALPSGDAAHGEQLFNSMPCHTCHTDMPIGPAFPGDPALAERAE